MKRENERERQPGNEGEERRTFKCLSGSVQRLISAIFSHQFQQELTQGYT